MIPYSDRGYIREKAKENGYSKEEEEFFEKLVKDFSDYRFVFGKKYAFRPPKTIVIGPLEPFSQLLALHEVGHAICKHKSFKVDIERLKMENQAWEEARKLAKKYGVTIDEELIQDQIDTYRDWLHQKSRCPDCGLTRFQTPDGQYHCPRCEGF